MDSSKSSSGVIVTRRCSNEKNPEIYLYVTVFNVALRGLLLFFDFNNHRLALLSGSTQLGSDRQQQRVSQVCKCQLVMDIKRHSILTSTRRHLSCEFLCLYEYT